MMHTNSSKSLFYGWFWLNQIFFSHLILSWCWSFGMEPYKLATILAGTLIAFIEYIFHALFSFMLLRLFHDVSSSHVSAQRIQEILIWIRWLRIIQKNGTTIGKSSLEFRDDICLPRVTWKSPRSVMLVLQQNRGVAFIGSTDLKVDTDPPRFKDVTEGQVLVDGQDVREYSLKTWEKNWLLLSHKKHNYLQERLCRDNSGLRGKRTQRKRKWKRLQIAQAADFIAQNQTG